MFMAYRDGEKRITFSLVKYDIDCTLRTTNRRNEYNIKKYHDRISYSEYNHIRVSELTIQYFGMNIVQKIIINLNH